MSLVASLFICVSRHKSYPNLFPSTRVTVSSLAASLQIYSTFIAGSKQAYSVSTD